MSTNLKYREKEKLSGWPEKLNEKKSDRDLDLDLDLEREIKNKRNIFFVGRTK